MVARLQALGGEDLERQVAFIQGSVCAHVARDMCTCAERAARRSMRTEPSRTATHGRVAGTGAGYRPADHGTPSGGRMAVRLGSRFTHLVQAEGFRLQPMGYDLYGGTCGVAMFLAAVEKVTGGAGYRKLALGAAQPLRQALRDCGNRTARDMGIGGASGRGSVTTR